MNLLSGIKEISNNYSHFILDVWGVIHDGIKTYPDVLDTMNFLKSEGKNVCFLSNAPRRASKVKTVLENYGITEDFYDFILTSGEATFIDLKKSQENGFENFGKNYFYIGPQKDIDLLDGLEYQRVESAAEADFALTTGFEGHHSKIDEKMPQALEAKKHNLKMICVNPDMIVAKQDGNEMICAGTLAREYKKIGGEVIYYGKPFESVYKITCELFNNPSKEKIIAIGDGLETDIKGAVDFGIDSILVSGGIMANRLDIKFWENPDMNKLKNICDLENTSPKYVISNFKI